MFVQQVANAREFLALALPWAQPGQPQTFVNIHYGVPDMDRRTGLQVVRNGKSNFIYPGMACRDVNEAQRIIDWANALNTDIYVCMSAQIEAVQATGKSGRTYYKAKRSSANAAFLKSLYVDVDVKPSDLTKGYADPQEAAQEFGRIRREIGLPVPSLVVRSGSGGFHAHWCMDNPLLPADWQVLATALVNALLAKGFRGDTQCVIDSARLLRVPGTWNHKWRRAGTGDPNPVTQLGNSNGEYFAASLQTALAPYIGVAAVPSASTRATAPIVASSLGPISSLFAQAGTPNNLASGVETNLPTIDEVALGCPWVAASLGNGGASNNNPLWLQSTNVALFCQDSRATAHRLASGHATYNQADTDALYERQSQTKASRNMGWPRCTSIANYGATPCQGCPHLALAKSPLNHTIRQVNTAALAPTVISALLGTLPTPSAPPPMPNDYQIDAHGFVNELVTDDQGAQTLSRICDFTMDKPWLQEHPSVLNFSTFTFMGNERQIKLPYETIVDKNAFGKTMAKQGMLVQGGAMRGLGDFMVAWVDKLRADRGNVVQSAPFGWSVTDGKVDGFVYAGHLWSKGQPKPAANSDPVLSSQYTPAGELPPWVTAAKMITDQRRPALDAVLAASFAAPLVRFTGQTGLLMSTYSTESGIGKSTTLKIAQAVWAHPQTAIQSLSDTQNAVIKKIGDIKNLPLFWDELKTEEDTRKFMALAFQLAGGKEKSRLASDTTYRDPGTWQTLLCSTSNDSLLAYILSATKTTSAGLYRVFEFVVPPGVTGKIDVSKADVMISELNDNFGQAGLKYAQFLGNNYDRISKEVGELQLKLEKGYAIKADERFWLALVTTIIAGAHYSNELGLTNIDELALRRFMIQKLEGMRGERKTTTVDISVNVNVLTHLARYLNEKKRNFSIVTSTIHRGPGRPPQYQASAIQQAAGVILSRTDLMKINAVQVQYGDTDKWVRMAKASFEEWIAKEGMTPTLIVRQLESQFGVREIRGRLGAGTAFVTASEPLLEFNYGDPVFQDFIEL